MSEFHVPVIPVGKIESDEVEAALVRVAKDALYAEMSKGWEKEFKAPPPPPPADFKRRVVKTDGLPLKGSDKAKVTIVECSDFDCPFCKRGAGTIEQVAKEFGDKVAVYYAHNPLPMHKQAEPAHRAPAMTTS